MQRALTVKYLLLESLDLSLLLNNRNVLAVRAVEGNACKRTSLGRNSHDRCRSRRSFCLAGLSHNQPNVTGEGRISLALLMYYQSSNRVANRNMQQQTYETLRERDILRDMTYRQNRIHDILIFSGRQLEAPRSPSCSSASNSSGKQKFLRGIKRRYM